MEKFASGLDDRAREREAAKIMEEEMNIQEFTVEPEMAIVLTDFPIKPYAEIDHVEEDPNPILPIDFYDNEDGFWDEYIQYKQKKLGQGDMIVNRRFMKH